MNEESVNYAKHLQHIEDQIYDGHYGAKNAIQIIEILSNLLRGVKPQDVSNYVDRNYGSCSYRVIEISTKMDGSPSVVFGYHPNSKAFFVGTKSVFNKTPKINYSHADIDLNHGSDTELASVLKCVFDYAPKMFYSKCGVYQADVMFTKNSAVKNELSVEFQPNTIKYRIEKADFNYYEFGRLSRANLCLAIHTKFDGYAESSDSLVGLIPNFSLDCCDSLESCEDVYIMRQNYFDFHEMSDRVEDSSSIPVISPKYMVKEQLHSVKSKISSFDHTITSKYATLLNLYTNYTIKNSKIINTADFAAFVKNRLETEANSYKTEAKKTDALNYANVVTKDIEDNKESFEKIFLLHDLVTNYKNNLILVMNSMVNCSIKHYIGDKMCGPEGYVVTRSGRPVKLINRAEFSKSNFQNSKYK